MSPECLKAIESSWFFITGSGALFVGAIGVIMGFVGGVVSLFIAHELRR